MTVYRHAPQNGGAGIHVENFDFWYGDFHALSGVSMDVAPNKITAFIGPSGCGKSTFLRCMNRMNDLIEGTHTSGLMAFDGNDIYADGVDPVDLRRRVGMIFQQPNPFPKSIYENVAFGPRLLGVNSKSELDGIVEESLKRSNLWKEVADQLDKNGLALSGGQQQRVAIGRALVTRPALILADEPTGNLDSKNSQEVLALLQTMSAKYQQTILMITHNKNHASAADRIFNMSDGVLKELGASRK